MQGGVQLTIAAPSKGAMGSLGFRHLGLRGVWGTAQKARASPVLGVVKLGFLDSSCHRSRI